MTNTLEVQADEHARLSPSAAKRWMACPGSVVLTADMPDDGNVASDRGTAMHYIAKVCLTEHWRAERYVDDMVPVHKPGQEPRYVRFTSDHADVVQDYVDVVREMSIGNPYRVEHRVEFSDVVGTPGQFGTADFIVIDTRESELVIVDLKTGYRFVEVAENKQLMIYALGALAEFELAYDIRSVRLCIYQPDHGGMREWTCTVEQLLEFGKQVRAAAQRVGEATVTTSLGLEWYEKYLHPNPNEEDCAFCKAAATCPAKRAKLQREVGADFEDLEQVQQAAQRLPAASEPDLSKVMAVIGELEDYCKAVRAEVERRLVAGGNTPEVAQALGYGLELGRQGARRWKDEAEAEKLLKERYRLKVDQMYDKSLKSPTQIEKLAKAGDLSDKRWADLQACIDRAPAKPSVKPITAIKQLWVPPAPAAEDFQPVADGDLS